jgi:zinc protease
MRLAMSAAYEGHPYSTSPLGSEDSLRGLSVEDVRQWFRGNLLSTQFVVGIVGDVIPEDAAGVLARELGRLRSSHSSSIDAPQWPDAPVINEESRDKAQTALVLAFPGPSRRDESRFAGQLAATIASGLGGRFFDELRDRQSLAYTVHAYTSERSLSGMFLAYIATSPEKEDVARRGLLAEFQRFCDAAVTEDELSRAKKYTIGSHAIAQESGATILGNMLDAWMFGAGLNELAEFESRISAVTAEDILKFARESFDPSRMVQGVVRGVGRMV